MDQSDTHRDSAADTATRDSAADTATDSTVTAEGWQGGYETSATERTGYAGQADAQDEGQWNSTEEAAVEQPDQQWGANQTDAEGYSTSQDYSYESALHQTTEQFEQYYQSEETVTDRWADETGEGEESLANQWRSESQDLGRSESQDLAEQQMFDQQPGEQQADEQPGQQPEEEQPIADSQPADLNNGEDQEQMPADDFMPNVPNSDAASQYDPYLAPESESRPNELSASDSGDESGDSAGQWQEYESRYDPYAEYHDPGMLGAVEQQESAASQNQYGNWEDAQAGIPVQAETAEAFSPQATESVYEQNAQPIESGYRYEYEYCPSDAAPRYEYTPFEPAYGCPYPNDVQQDDRSIDQQPAETTENRSAEAPCDDQFQADPAQQDSDNDMEATGSREVDAEETQPGDDQSGDAAEGESLDWPTGVRSWDEEQSCRQDENSWGDENQSYNEGEQYNEEQMQSDDGASQHVPCQESPYDVIDDSNGSDEQNWQSPCAQYPHNTQEASQSERFEHAYKCEHPCDDFRADDSNFKPYVPEEVTSSPAWESSSADNREPQLGCRDLQAEAYGYPSENQTREFADQIECRHAEQSSEATCHDGYWSTVQQSSEGEHSGDDGYAWDAGYGKYGASSELATPADQTAEDSQRRDRPDPDEESDARSEDVELSRPSDQQMDSSADSQSAGDNQGASDQYDSPAEEREDSAEPQSHEPVSEETETEDATMAPRWSEGWVPSKPQTPDAMPAVEDPIGNQGEQSNPFPADAGSNWMPLPNYGYPASPTSTEYFLPPHIHSDYPVEFRGRQ